MAPRRVPSCSTSWSRISTLSRCTWVSTYAGSSSPPAASTRSADLRADPGADIHAPARPRARRRPGPRRGGSRRRSPAASCGHQTIDRPQWGGEPLPGRRCRASHPEARRGRPHHHPADPLARPGPGGRQGGPADPVEVRVAGWSRSPTSTCSSTRGARWTWCSRPRRSRRTATGIADDYPRYTTGTVMLETAERLTAEEKEPATQQFLLLVGGLRTLAEASHAPGWCWTRSCSARWPSRDTARPSTTARAARAPVRTRSSTSSAGGVGMRVLPGLRLGVAGPRDAGPAGGAAHR